MIDAGIPMTAWIVLPKAHGYYVNVGNAAQTAARFSEFDKWTTDNGLRWEAVGLDIEPTFQEFGSLTGDVRRLAIMVIRRSFDWERVRRARGDYQALVRQHAGPRLSLCKPINSRSSPTTEGGLDASATHLRSRGRPRQRGSADALQSLSEPFGAGLIWAYRPDAQIVAVAAPSQWRSGVGRQVSAADLGEVLARSAGRASLRPGGRDLQPGRVRAPGIHGPTEGDGLERGGDDSHGVGRAGEPVSVGGSCRSVGGVSFVWTSSPSLFWSRHGS